MGQSVILTTKTISMKTKNYTTFFIAPIMLVISLKALAQEIKDDTIYTSIKQQTTLYFPASITICDYNEESAYTRFSKRIENSMVSIVAKLKAPQPAVLKVSEGKRNHRFILAYKEDLSTNELDHNWEDIKVLKNYVANRPVKSAPKQQPAVVVNDKPNTLAVNSNTSAVATSSDNAGAVSSKSIDKTSTKEATNDNYDVVISQAYNLFQNKKYTEAKVLYEKAAALRPDEKIAKDKITEINGIQSAATDEADKLKREKDFHEKIKAADKTFEAKNFEEAKGLYSLALSLKPNDVYTKKRLDESQRKLAEQIVGNQNKAKEESFQKSIIAGKKAYDEKKYEDARAAFSMAADTKPADQFSRSRIKAIDKILKETEQQKDLDRKNKERETAYNDAVTIANDAYNNGNYHAALSGYKKAKVLKEDAYVNEQIKKINQLKAKEAAEIANEKIRLEKEKRDNELYKKYLAKADQFFEVKKYRDAKINYSQALNYKNEQYAKDKVAEIETIESKIAEENELKKKYNEALVKGKAALANGDYDKAKTFYEEAVTLKPSEPAAQDQLKIIYKKLESIAKEKEIDNHYDSCLSKAAFAISTTDYKKAQDFYKEAGLLKPAEDYPAKMIVYLEGVLKEEGEKQKHSEAAKRRSKIINVKARADQAVFNKNWRAALEGFEEILTLNPTKGDEEFARQKITSIEAEIAKADAAEALKTAPAAVTTQQKRSKDQAKRDAIFAAAHAKEEQKRLASIEDQLKNLEKKKQQTLASASNSSKADNIETSSYLQSDPIPYSHSELVKKYPAIDFDETPDGQTFDPTDRKNRAQNFEVSNKIIAQKGNLYVYDSVSNVKAICQNIFFNGSNSYIKLIVQNNSSRDFLTGPMQLKLIKKNGTSIDINQRFISNFPVVMPKKEFAVVYVANATINIEPTDILVLEVNDRIKKMKLKIKIPVDIYLREKTASL